MEDHSEKLKQQIRMHEGVKHKVYLDTKGISTIGVGRNLEGRGLSADEVDYLLGNDLDICVDELNKSFKWYAGLDDIRKRVLVDMAFNLGMPRLKGFVKMLEEIKKENWSEAAIEMLESRWADQVGNRASRLSEMMETGEDYIG